MATKATPKRTPATKKNTAPISADNAPVSADKYAELLKRADAIGARLDALEKVIRRVAKR